MQTLSDGYRGFGLVMMLNRDRLIYVSAIFLALTFGAWLGTLQHVPHDILRCHFTAPRRLAIGAMSF